MRRTRTLIAAGAAVIVAVAAVVAVGRATGDERPFRLDLAAADITATNRSLAEAVDCPIGGRLDPGLGPPLPATDFVAAGDRAARNLVAPGQVVPFEFELRANDASPPGPIEFTAGWERGDVRGAGFDAGAAVCAFVDTSDPSTVDGGDPAAVAWTERPVTQDELMVDVAVQGVGPGDRVIIELWMVSRSTLSSSTASLSVRVIRADGPAPVDVRRDELRYRLAFFDRTQQPELMLAVSDDEPAGAPRAERIVYRWIIENPSQVALVPLARMDTRLDPSTALDSDVAVTDTQGYTTTCQPSPVGFGCDLGFVNPGEVITLEAAVAVRDSAERRNTREEEGCAEQLFDICAQTVVSWKVGEDREAQASVEQPSDLPTAGGLTIAKFVDGLAPVAYDGQPVTFRYAVSASATRYLQLEVTDDRCPTVALDGGDGNRNAELDPGETWQYRCTVEAIDADDAAGTSKVDALDADGRPATAVTRTQITLIRPALQVQVGGVPEDAAGRRLEVTNAGDSNLSEPAVTASNCSAVEFIGVDQRLDRLMEPGETWHFQCAVINANQPVRARAYAVDVLGNPVTATPQTT